MTIFRPVHFALALSLSRALLRRTLLVLASAWLATMAGCALDARTPPAPAPQAEARPIVLVHGAWMGAWAWGRVAATLQQQGFAVTVVELPGHGADRTPPEQLTLAGYVEAVRTALPPGPPAVVVGHSMAGMVISQLAEREPERVRALVYVAAYLPRNGESLYEISQSDTLSRVPRFWKQANPAAYSPAFIKPEGIAEVFCAECSAADQTLLVTRHRAEALAPLGTPVALSAERFGRVPKTYVQTLKDQAVTLGLQQAMVARAGSGVTVHTLDTGHAPMLSQPSALAELIAQAARTGTR